MQDLDLVVVQLFLDGRFSFPRDLAPQVRCITQLEIALVYPQVNRLFRSPLNHNRIETRKFEFSREEPAALRIADRTGQR